jgi:glutaredoxin/glutathione-dependent peroxiredoxin
MIAVGQRIPECDFSIMTENGPSDMSTREIFAGKNVILFGVPGAFTPSCHYLHLPSYIAEYDNLRRAGLDTIACTAVNDIFVLDVWAQQTGAKGKIQFLADGNAEFAIATGLGLNARGFGLGIRSRRYALWARNGIVQLLNVEEDPTVAEVSTAYSMLKMFNQWNEAGPGL